MTYSRLTGGGSGLTLSRCDDEDAQPYALFSAMRTPRLRLPPAAPTYQTPFNGAVACTLSLSTSIPRCSISITQDRTLNTATKRYAGCSNSMGSPVNRAVSTSAKNPMLLQ